MDKNKTGEIIRAVDDPLLISAAKISFQLGDGPDVEKLWQTARQKLQTDDILIKPQADGCSAGVVRLQSAKELGIYLKALSDKEPVLPPETLTHQSQAVELPVHVDALILEPFIATDDIRVENLELIHKPKIGWVELTVGVLEQGRKYHALSPSITVAQNAVLSLEEKFQGGTGVNLNSRRRRAFLKRIKLRLSKPRSSVRRRRWALEGYARIDIFFNTRSNQTMIIEANSLPGLTASTVIFHQALAETPPLSPREFLSKLVEVGIGRRNVSRGFTNKQKVNSGVSFVTPSCR